MTVVAATSKGVLVVRVQGSRLDATTGRDVKRRLYDFKRRARRGVVIDLSQVEFIDSSGLTTLVWTLRLVRSPFLVRLVGVGSGPREVLSLTRLDRVLSCHATLQEAIASLEEERLARDAS